MCCASIVMPHTWASTYRWNELLPRFHVNAPLSMSAQINLPSAVVRHIQVLRLQPGSALCLFNGDGDEWDASIVSMGRGDVLVELEACRQVNRELACNITVAIGMPANDRMDWLIEKSCELGASAIQPLICSRSVLRLEAARAEKRVAHWQGIAVAACEQSGRARIPHVASIRALNSWLSDEPLGASPLEISGRAGVLLSPAGAAPLAAHLGKLRAAGRSNLVFLSGPEGGLSDHEEAQSRAAGFVDVTLGPRILRADTAPLAALVTAASVYL